MAIQFICPHCGQQTNVDDMYAGQSGPCANCGQTVSIPGKPGQSAAKSSGGAGMIIGIVIACLAGLCCLCAVPAALLPLVQVNRESARDSSCRNNLKQIGLALHNYHDTYKCFPAAVITDSNGRPMHSWRVAILPFLEQSYMFEQINFNEPWDSPFNSQFHSQCPEVYRCPSDDENHIHGCSYRVVAGASTPWGNNRFTGFRDITDGTSNTIAVVESHDAQINWMQPTPLDMDTLTLIINAGEINSHHPNKINALMFDGSVHALEEFTDQYTLRNLLENSDGNPVSF